MSIKIGVDGVVRENTTVQASIDGVIRNISYGFLEKGSIIFNFYGDPFEQMLGVAVRPYRRIAYEHSSDKWVESSRLNPIPIGTPGENLGDFGEWSVTDTGLYIKPSSEHRITIYSDIYPIYTDSILGYGRTIADLMADHSPKVEVSGNALLKYTTNGSGAFAYKLFTNDVINAVDTKTDIVEYFNHTYESGYSKNTWGMANSWGVYNGRTGDAEFNFTGLLINGKSFPIVFIGAPTE